MSTGSVRARLAAWTLAQDQVAEYAEADLTAALKVTEAAEALRGLLDEGSDPYLTVGHLWNELTALEAALDAFEALP